MKVKGARKLRDILMSMSERKKAILITVLLLIVSVVNFVVDIYKGLSRADIVIFACRIFLVLILVIAMLKDKTTK